jgi:hypothetical protein
MPTTAISPQGEPALLVTGYDDCITSTPHRWRSIGSPPPMSSSPENPRGAKKDADFLRQNHGWEVPLVCSKCGANEKPIYNGWTPTAIIRFGQQPTIYANLSCAGCGKDLKPEAEQALVALFRDVRIPTANRWAIIAFVVLICLVSLVLPAVLWGGAWAGWWPAAAAGTAAGVGALPWLIRTFNRRIYSLKEECECGQPAYHFMGLLGRTECFRCATCGRLLRLRG